MVVPLTDEDYRELIDGEMKDSGGRQHYVATLRRRLRMHPFGYAVEISAEEARAMLKIWHSSKGNTGGAQRRYPMRSMAAVGLVPPGPYVRPAKKHKPVESGRLF